ncbi:MAG: hypothetical protein R3C45_12505 [Phycisphaerales bacterium]
MSYNELTNELTVTYAGLTEGPNNFSITWFADNFLTDLAGNYFDGEINSLTTVPSGNGSAGGFHRQFHGRGRYFAAAYVDGNADRAGGQFRLPGQLYGHPGFRRR